MTVPSTRTEPARGTGGVLAGVALQLGDWREREGDLAEAADWFRRAFELPGAHRPAVALRLGDVLGRMAEEHRAQCEDVAEPLLAEATRWLVTAAGAATTPDAIELVTDMLNRHQRQAARRGLLPAAGPC